MQLKAFYVDLLVPLETNLEKDTKVVQHEQKKFMQQHKVRMESYHKAVTTMKKQRKKKASPENTEKELRVSIGDIKPLPCNPHYFLFLFFLLFFADLTNAGGSKEKIGCIL